MKISIRQKLWVLSFIILAGNGFMGYAVYKSHQKLRDAEQLVQHTEEVIYQSSNILSLGKDIETASRGYVITKDSTFLKPLLNAEKIIFDYVRQLKQLTLDNPAQQLRIDSLNFYIKLRLDFSLQTIELRNKQGLASAITYVSAKQGKHYFDHIRKIIREIQVEESTLLKQRKQTNENSVATFNLFSWVMLILMAVFTILLLIATSSYLLQNNEKEKREAELVIANRKLATQSKEREKRAAELTIANEELAFQSGEKEKRAAELTVANVELAFQSEEKEKRAAELTIANRELAFQSEEKGKRAAELTVANIEMAFQSEEKEKRAAELTIANKELAFQSEEKGKRAAELTVANIELAFQSEEKEKRAAELTIANKELAFQSEEKEKRAAELTIANKELAFQSAEKGKRAAELTVANVELAFQSEEKEKRAAELTIANKELAFQSEEKGKRAAELTIANKELAFQSQEKGKRAAELTVANKELAFQSEEKEKRAEELINSNKELESFSYSVSHDLRSPLRAVHGYARMLKEDYGSQVDSEANRVMNSIMSNAKKMGQLLDDLLTFSRLGRKELIKVKIPMHDMVSNLCAEINEEHIDRNIQFVINDLQPADGDHVVIKQVWINLISNAVKYSRHTEKAIITISSWLEGDEIIYSIKDNGIGFDMRYANKLFGVFQRLHTDEQFEGTGVGLAIVHRIVSKHGGRVWADSKVNEGATFYFSLPVKNTLS